MCFEPCRTAAQTAAGQRNADHSRVRDCDDGVAVHFAHFFYPVVPTLGNHLRRFSAAGPVAPRILRPFIDLPALDGIPASALPFTEAHLDQIIIGYGFTRRRQAPSEPPASTGGTG